MRARKDFFAARNLLLIHELMDILDIQDCEELPTKVIELKEAAQQTRSGDPSPKGSGFTWVCKCNIARHVVSRCVFCGAYRPEAQNPQSR